MTTQALSLDQVRERILASRAAGQNLPSNPSQQLSVDNLGNIIAGPVAAGVAELAGRAISRIPQKTFA